MKTPGQEMNAHSPQGPAQQPPQAASSGGGFPWGKVLAGCGCLTLLGVIALGVGGYFLFGAASDAAEESGVAAIFEEAKAHKEAAEENSGKSGKANADIEREARKAKDDALDHEKVRAYLREPFTKKDVREHQAFVDQWHEHPAYKNWVEQYEKMKEVSEENDESVSGKLRAAGQASKWIRSARDVMEAFDEYVRDNGGYEEYYARLVRIGGVITASDTMTKSNKKLDDANSDAVAKQMLTERPEIAREYAKNMKEAKKAAKRAKEAKAEGKKPSPGDQAALAGMMGMFQGPGTVALARMPEKSFKTWQSLSEAERKQLRESLDGSIAPGPWFGLYQLNSTALVMAAYAAEFQALEAE